MNHTPISHFTYTQSPSPNLQPVLTVQTLGYEIWPFGRAQNFRNQKHAHRSRALARCSAVGALGGWRAVPAACSLLGCSAPRPRAQPGSATSARRQGPGGGTGWRPAGCLSGGRAGGRAARPRHSPLGASASCVAASGARGVGFRTAALPSGWACCCAAPCWTPPVGMH